MNDFLVRFVWFEVCVSGYIYAHEAWMQVLWTAYYTTAAVTRRMRRVVTTWGNYSR